MNNKWKEIKVIILFIILIITGIYFKIIFKDSIMIGLSIGLIMTYLAVITTSKEIRKINKLETKLNKKEK